MQVIIDPIIIWTQGVERRGYSEAADYWRMRQASPSRIHDRQERQPRTQLIERYFHKAGRTGSPVCEAFWSPLADLPVRSDVVRRVRGEKHAFA
jgi:hypothetical protein